jgi:hypothetical protein
MRKVHLAELRELVSSTDELFSTLQRVESNGDVREERSAGSRPSSVQLLLSNDAEGGDDDLCEALVRENDALRAVESDLARRVAKCDVEIASLRAAMSSIAGVSGAGAAVADAAADAEEADDDTRDASGAGPAAPAGSAGAADADAEEDDDDTSIDLDDL